jgi:hypothetical protein
LGAVPAATNSVRAGSVTFLARRAVLELDARQRAARVGHAGQRRQLLDEAHALLEELDDLLVVQAVGGAVRHRLAVDQRHPAPRRHQLAEVGRLARRRRARALGRTARPCSRNSRAISASSAS